MIDIITYIPDLAAFRLEANANAQSGTHGFAFDDDDGTINYNVAKIPVHYNPDGVRSLCLIRLMTEKDEDVFNALASCEKIGECINKEYIFDAGGEDIYNEVYDQTPVELDDGTFYTPPAMIGVFA